MVHVFGQTLDMHRLELGNLGNLVQVVGKLAHVDGLGGFSKQKL